MKYFVIFVITLFLSSKNYAETYRMVQVDKTFFGNITDEEAAKAFDNHEFEEKHKVETIKVKVGDSIQFVNRDEVNHNVSGWLNGTNLFDVKIQPPGPANDRTIELKKKGDFVIQCAIHPKMKIKLKVE